MRLLLVSTYELGRQPVHVASPAAALSAAGVDVDVTDLAVDTWDPARLDAVDAVAFSVPMHTAMRLAVPVAERVRELRPDLPIAFYGLYAGVGSGAPDVVDVRLVGEYEGSLVAWARSVPNGGELAVAQGRPLFHRPDRSGLPGHDSYARLEWQGEARRAAAVEASHGCRHRCRHCPVPSVYDGRMRVVGAEAVLADIDQLAADGVRHVTFGDPDFLNAPRYSMDVLRGAHAAHPELTYDVTVKVEHILEHEQVWPELASLGVLFVVSAFETTDDRTLAILEKGHTSAGMSRAVSIVQSAGIHIRPTWLPFFPWTTPGHVADIAGFIDGHRLWAAMDPVQLAIKLLIPDGSLLLEHPAVIPHLTGYDNLALTWSWPFENVVTARLHRELDSIAAEASDCGAEAADTLQSMRARIEETTGIGLGPMPASLPAPRLTESWFCCAEPTAGQATAVGLSIGRVPPAAAETSATEVSG
jgi:hypothetical protein